MIYQPSLMGKRNHFTRWRFLMNSYNAWYENVWFLEKMMHEGPPLNLTTTGFNNQIGWDNTNSYKVATNLQKRIALRLCWIYFHTSKEPHKLVTWTMQTAEHSLNKATPQGSACVCVCRHEQSALYSEGPLEWHRWSLEHLWPCVSHPVPTAQGTHLG